MFLLWLMPRFKHTLGRDLCSESQYPAPAATTTAMRAIATSFETLLTTMLLTVATQDGKSIGFSRICFGICREVGLYGYSPLSGGSECGRRIRGRVQAHDVRRFRHHATPCKRYNADYFTGKPTLSRLDALPQLKQRYRFCFCDLAIMWRLVSSSSFVATGFAYAL